MDDKKLTPFSHKKVEMNNKTLIKYNRQNYILKEYCQMSHNRSIINLLHLKEKNIIFHEIFCREEKVKGVRVKVFYATLSYSPKVCYHYECVFD